MQLFYNPHITPETKQITFDKTESRHIIRVLRKKLGDQLFITNGKGVLFISEISIADDKKCLVNIISVNEKSKSWDYYLHIAIAPTKNMDRFEWFLEKATEIGIDEITPIICERSERKIIKSERLEKIIESAMKQSLHYYLPKFNEPITFKDFLKKEHSGQKFVAHCEETDKKSLKSLVKPNENVTVLIGPEGDFSNKEITLALENNYIPVTLGSTRLRTETAAIVACHSVVFIND